ncbi:lipid asymmetry maintenance protein MlaB [Wohlfahrtiimonas sp. G9077]|uniref:STAS domain-containing protein n=1 Tax=Wohlfahrtiimonas sp. G9077 TaxID=1980118 RepID=UPI000B9940CC|nr:hypothetical protein [Wohlfahrtiimonas sp. G9077]OYQ75325.1 hypothetical protein B9T20_01105 [Wohlfahrtiimonas sp. G9077]
MSECCQATGQGVYQLVGDFNKFTIPEYDRVIRAAFKKEAPTALSLNTVSSCDSAFVALLISYKHDYPDLALDAVPDQLTKLLALYHVAEWFVH